LPASDLGRWADSKHGGQHGIYVYSVSISTRTLRRNLCGIRSGGGYGVCVIPRRYW
jgi:hypothetical protein